MLCVDQAFRQAYENLTQFLGGKYSVNTLESTNQRMGVQAGEFLFNLPTPPKAEEEKHLVATLDGKGILMRKPLIETSTMATRVSTHQIERTLNHQVAELERVSENLDRDCHSIATIDFVQSNTIQWICIDLPNTDPRNLRRELRRKLCIYFRIAFSAITHQHKGS